MNRCGVSQPFKEMAHLRLKDKSSIDMLKDFSKPPACLHQAPPLVRHCNAPPSPVQQQLLQGRERERIGDLFWEEFLKKEKMTKLILKKMSANLFKR